jgi:transposase-like protein
VAGVEIIARVERRRKWTAEEKAAPLAELEAEGGNVAAVAQRHRISESLLYSCRWPSRAAAARSSEPVMFVPIGVVGRTNGEEPTMSRQPMQSKTLTNLEGPDRRDRDRLADACRPTDCFREG